MLTPGGVVVTGAASGIGRAVALRLAAQGAPVALVDRDATGLSATAAAAERTTGAPVLTLVADVTSDGEVAAALGTAHDRFGPLAGLVTAAGVLEPGGLADVSRASWDRHLAVNTTGVLHCLQRGAPLLRDGAAVVVVSSNAARVPRTGMLAYAASKAATSALARCAGLELAGRGIRCNVVEPGSTDTPMQRALWPDPLVGAHVAVEGDPGSFRVGIPLGRLAEPEDVAATVCFLLSDDARHVTLQQLYVDGGASL
ncbi:2,3-dihydro-2,3-dihydroxybenzoate dehydrogenase [Cellulomonas sp. HZM]|uniref:2,3-dihydro-2,3-dihydroxybenzoate dehydrogenase n=1 Tax=Cellulomonas sp. HZM TaxID=1454010 RepID=UPI0004933145|nr:2,3-dihydro-2,3-dihydroxybenzoate dehydrogenase [Cellulomonas sp. HZM]